jgi:DNA invertase Pin-like site-specific DNA recombinase
MGTDLCAVPYLRTSTDDKDQDPLRQLSSIQAWAAREHVQLLPHVIDEGSSAFKIGPFDRPRFMEAVTRAQAANAGGILVETVDRFTRPQDVDDFVYARMRLKREYGLSLWFADVPLKDTDEFTGRIMTYVRAYGAGEYSKLLSKRVREGMKRKGAGTAKSPFGRPRKLLTAMEIAYIDAARQEETGYPTITREINRRRGVDQLVTNEAREKRQVSETLVRREHKRFLRGRSETPHKVPATKGAA